MRKSLKIKVCGMRDPENIEALCELAPDFIGYIFYPGSVRYVGDNPDRQIFRLPEKQVKKVGVFVNEDLDRVKRCVDKFWLDLVQLHGEESPEYCSSLAEFGVSIIKILPPPGASAALQPGAYLERVSYFLYDTPSVGYGGSGKKFNWEMLEEYSIPIPFFLSGGIGPDDSYAIRSIRHNWLFAVDINSRFEERPGVKRIEEVRRFIEMIRN